MDVVVVAVSAIVSNHNTSTNVNCNEPLEFRREVFNEDVVDDSTAEVWSTDCGTDAIHAAVDGHHRHVGSPAANTHHHSITAHHKKPRMSLT